MEELLFDTVMEMLHAAGMEDKYVENVVLGQRYDVLTGDVESVAIIRIGRLEYARNKKYRLSMPGIAVQLIYVGEITDTPMSRSAFCKLSPEEQAKARARR